jgi:hypothetical protein
MQEIQKYCLTGQKNLGRYNSKQKTSKELKKNPRHVSREIVFVRRRVTIVVQAARKGFLKAGFYLYLLRPLPDALI